MGLLSNFISSSLFKASGLYVVASILNSSIPFLLLPVMTRYLSPEDYGLISMFFLLASIISLFVGLNMYGAVNRAFFDHSIDFKEFVANSLYIVAFGFFATLLVISIFGLFINKLSGVPYKWILISVAYSLLSNLVLFNLVIRQVQMDAKSYAYIQVGQALSHGILSVLFVVLMGMKWEGRLLASLITISVFGCFSAIILVKYWTVWRVNKSYIIYALKYGIPLIPHAAGSLAIVATDRFIIANTLGLREVGVYTVALQLGSVISLLAESFNKAYVPWLFGKLNLNDRHVKERIVKLSYLYFLLAFLFAAGYGVFAPAFINFFVGRSFQGSSEVVLWIAIGGGFHAMYYMVTNYILYSNKTYLLAMITVVCGGLNIPITYYLTHKIGINGAAIAYAIIAFIYFMTTWVVSARISDMNWIPILLRRNM